MTTFNQINEKIGRYRWTICALIFFATTINYLDRNVLGLLKPFLEEEMGWTEKDYSHIVMAFQLAYALGMIVIGRVIDRVGTKLGYFFSLLGWSIAAIVHGFAHSKFTFAAARALLGVTESGNFPAANKAVAEWFPKKERALATGIYNSGANIGSIVAPLCVPLIAIHWGWEWAFFLTGAIGLVWLFFWWKIYKSPSAKLAEGKLTQAEYDYIHSDKEDAAAPKEDTAPKTDDAKPEKISWVRILRYRQTWAFFFGKLLTDPIWWFYMFWLPAYLTAENAYKIEMGNPQGVISWPLAIAVVYSISTLGSIFGGWLPKYLINKRGKTVYGARMLSLFLYALLPLTVLAVRWLGDINTWLAVLVIGLACAAHQAWSANMYPSVSDMFPRKAVGSVTGLGGAAGAFGGMLIAWGAGMLLHHFKLLGNIEVGYSIMFTVCALAYIVAWVVMKVLVPRFRSITDL